MCVEAAAVYIMLITWEFGSTNVKLLSYVNAHKGSKVKLLLVCTGLNAT